MKLQFRYIVMHCKSLSFMNISFALSGYWRIDLINVQEWNDMKIKKTQWKNLSCE